MGLLGNMMSQKERNQSKRLNLLIDRAKKLYYGMENQEMLTLLYQIEKSEHACQVRPLEFCLDMIEMIFNNTRDFNPSNQYQTVRLAERIFSDIFIYEENTPDYEDNKLVFLELFEEGGVVAKNVFRLDLYQTFRDKFHYIWFMNSVLNREGLRECLPEITSYALTVRQYYIDDMTYASHMIFVTRNLISLIPQKRAGYMTTELAKVQRLNGIYNIDATDIAKAEKQLALATEIMASGGELMTQIDTKVNQMNVFMEDYMKTLSRQRETEMTLAKSSMENMKTELVQTYHAFVDEQKEKIIFDRKLFVDSLLAESKQELDQIKTLASVVASNATMELNRVQQEAEKTVQKVDQMVHSDVEVQRILNLANANKEFIDKVNKIEILSNTNMELLNERLMQNDLARKEAEEACRAAKEAALLEQIAREEAEIETTKKKAAKTENKTETKTIVNVTKGEVVAEPEVVFVEEPEDSFEPVNYLLDESIPFQERWKKVMEMKLARMKKGEHFHMMFDDVLMAVMENANPYLIGPSGCGKTFMVNQIAELLEVDSVDIGYINEEYDILGFQTANGGYSKPNFYRCYKYGRIAFCDELDNGNSRATVKLNSFLNNTVNACFNFPNGERVKRHANFRVIAAGNTAGNGADANYNTREKIEESVQQRFTPVYVGYDNAVENKILAKYPDWFAFMVLFRNATNAWEDATMSSAAGILTTRDSVRIKKYLDNQSFTPEKIIKYEFVQTKEVEYLSFLTKHMKDHLAEQKKAEKLYAIFDAQVTEIRRKGGKR